MISVCEVIDTTNEETYFPLGVFASLEAAMDAIEECRQPPPVEGGWGQLDEFCSVEIRGRGLGWSGDGEQLIRYEWEYRDSEWVLVTRKQLC